MILIFLFFLNALSSPLERKEEPARAEILLKAKNLNNLRYGLKNYEAQEKIKTKCELEIESKNLPISCYEYLYIRRRGYGVKEYLDQVKKLDDICEDSQKSHHKLKKTTYLSKACEKIVETRNQEIDYVKREQNPLGYFNNN